MSYMRVHNIIVIPIQTIAALALPIYIPVLKYTNKKGLELLMLLTIELCFVLQDL